MPRCSNGLHRHLHDKFYAHCVASQHKLMERRRRRVLQQQPGAAPRTDPVLVSIKTTWYIVGLALLSTFHVISSCVPDQYCAPGCGVSIAAMARARRCRASGKASVCPWWTWWPPCTTPSRYCTPDRRRYSGKPTGVASKDAVAKGRIPTARTTWRQGGTRADKKRRKERRQYQSAQGVGFVGSAVMSNPHVRVAQPQALNQHPPRTCTRRAQSPARRPIAVCGIVGDSWRCAWWSPGRRHAWFCWHRSPSTHIIARQ